MSTSLKSRTRTIITRDDGRFLIKVTNRAAETAPPDRFIVFPGGRVEMDDCPDEVNRYHLKRDLGVVLLNVVDLGVIRVKLSRSTAFGRSYTLFTAKIDVTPRIHESRVMKEEFHWVHQEELSELLVRLNARYDHGFLECLGVYQKSRRPA